jgi:hypothetical protein
MSLVRVQIPGESTDLITVSGEHLKVQIDEAGQRWVNMDEADAAVLINSGLPDSVAWRESNPHLVGSAAPQQQRGMRWSDILDAAENARPRHPLDKGGISADTLRLIGWWPR